MSLNSLCLYFTWIVKIPKRRYETRASVVFQRKFQEWTPRRLLLLRAFLHQQPLFAYKITRNPLDDRSSFSSTNCTVLCYILPVLILSLCLWNTRLLISIDSCFPIVIRWERRWYVFITACFCWWRYNNKNKSTATVFFERTTEGLFRNLARFLYPRK